MSKRVMITMSIVHIRHMTAGQRAMATMISAEGDKRGRGNRQRGQPGD